MSCDQKYEQRLRELQDNVRHTHSITPELMLDVITSGCTRFHAQHPIAKAKVARLIKSGAYNDAALALQDLELPQWKLRRMVYDSGSWHCSFSRQLAIPVELDEMAEATHDTLSGAILSAFLEARRISLTVNKVRSRSVPQVGSTGGHVVCCDNFV